MKKLAAWAAIRAAPAMIAGIHGMNFELTPELHWRYGHAVTMGAMVASCAGLYAWFTGPAGCERTRRRWPSR